MCSSDLSIASSSGCGPLSSTPTTRTVSRWRRSRSRSARRRHPKASRRSSSRVANPTTQGVTLRGVSGSGASRTLVLADGVPLNDPFGSWVYWNRIPQAAVDRVEVVRGATGDLYGAYALGGVVQLLTVQPNRTRARATFDGGSNDTFRGSMFVAGEKQGWNASAAYEGVRTDGAYVLAPEDRKSTRLNSSH